MHTICLAAVFCLLQSALFSSADLIAFAVLQVRQFLICPVGGTWCSEHGPLSHTLSLFLSLSTALWRFSLQAGAPTTWNCATNSTVETGKLVPCSPERRTDWDRWFLSAFYIDGVSPPLFLGTLLRSHWSSIPLLSSTHPRALSHHRTDTRSAFDSVAVEH